LGIRQRLSLAVAVIHEPEMLILDEPTSGVDPVARDGFWELLIELSRNSGVTIFISTHFMNEAARCDRISLMHAGKVLAQGKPAELVEKRGSASLEDAFLAYLEDASESSEPRDELATESEAGNLPTAVSEHSAFSLGRVWAFARREAVELRHDSIRLAFAVVGPLILMIAFGYGISLDVDHLPFAVMDSDGTAASRLYADSFRGSKYFDERPPIYSYDELDRRMRNGNLRFEIEIPSGFEKNLKRGRIAEVRAWLDAAVPFRAELTRGYIENAQHEYIKRLRRAMGLPREVEPVKIDVRLLFNQAFKSIYAMVPADIMLLLILIPCMLTALSVVREKEHGSIANFYAAPATRLEFLAGKQLPYFGVALVQFALLVALGIFLFRVPMKGSWPTLLAGGVIYLFASTGFGLLISVFAPTQTAAIFAAAIITVLPAIQFSGMYAPVSSLTGAARFLARIFPSTYFQAISVGTFTKAIGFAPLWRNFAVLTAIALLYFTAAWKAGTLEAERGAHPSHRSPRGEGAYQPGTRSRPAVPYRLLLHLFGLCTGKERSDGGQERIDCGRGRRRFGRFAPDNGSSVAAALPPAGRDSVRRHKSSHERKQIYFRD
jgi:ribosome-dependent ATPase